MDWSQILPWFNPLMAIVSLIYTWVATRDKDNSQHIKAVEDALSKRIAEHAALLASQQLLIESIRAEQRHMPTHRDVTELQQRLASLEATAKSSSEELKAARDAIESVRDFLLNKSKS